MGHRTLSLRLIFEAFFLRDRAYEDLRHDDNPFVEGLFLVVLVGALTAVLAWIGQLLAWASTPQVDAIKQVILEAYKQMPWWTQATTVPGFAEQFQRFWDLGWRVFPVLFHAANPANAALNILLWPLVGVVSWLIYGLLAHLFARMLRGVGTLNQTLGVTALAFTPLLLRGLEFIPFLTIGAVVLNTWQLICRYKALRIVHQLSWGRAFWATLLPFAVYALIWLVLGGLAIVVMFGAIASMRAAPSL
jgi:hypothetical protein